MEKHLFQPNPHRQQDNLTSVGSLADASDPCSGKHGLGEARRLSFRALDIEQIGHVYEGLLIHTAKRAKLGKPVIALIGTAQKESEVGLAELEALMKRGKRLFD